MYKALLTSAEKELEPIFVSLKMMIPINFNKEMVRVWRGDRDAIIEFVMRFLEVNNKPLQKKWDKIKFY